MKYLSLIAGLSAGLFATVALAQNEMSVRDAYARASSPAAQAGAAFMVIENHSATDDRLIAAESDAAERVELHSHSEDAAGVMRMIALHDGVVIPAGGERALSRGGDHIMLLGLTRPLVDGETISVTLTFERSGDLVIEVPVDSAHVPGESHADGHGHGHGN